MRGARAAHDYSGELTADHRSVTQHGADGSELLSALCWCESTTVVVEQRDVVACLTRSCGAGRCHGPNGERERSVSSRRRMYSWTRSLALSLHERERGES